MLRLSNKRNLFLYGTENASKLMCDRFRVTKQKTIKLWRCA